MRLLFYHSEKLQSTKTGPWVALASAMFYHSEKLQSTKTAFCNCSLCFSFIIAKNYRVLKQ